MNITVITGSGRKKGTSGFLADEFIRGAKEAGNEVYRFDAAFEDIRPCIGCNACRKTGKCVQDEAYDQLIPHLLNADEVVWVTPVYYMTMTSQLKMVIDRMYQLETNPRFRGGKKYILLMTAWDSNPKVFSILIQTFAAFCRFLRWEYGGAVLAAGMDTREEIEKSHYGKEAYELGKQQK